MTTSLDELKNNLSKMTMKRVCHLSIATAHNVLGMLDDVESMGDNHEQARKAQGQGLLKEFKELTDATAEGQSNEEFMDTLLVFSQAMVDHATENHKQMQKLRLAMDDLKS